MATRGLTTTSLHTDLTVIAVLACCLLHDQFVVIFLHDHDNNPPATFSKSQLFATYYRMFRVIYCTAHLCCPHCTLKNNI